MCTLHISVLCALYVYDYMYIHILVFFELYIHTQAAFATPIRPLPHRPVQELKRAQKDFASACATEKHQADTIRPVAGTTALPERRNPNFHVTRPPGLEFLTEHHY